MSARCDWIWCWTIGYDTGAPPLIDQPKQEEEQILSEVQTYAPGVPSWIDLSSPDLDRTRDFYSRLFGWEAFTVPDPDAGGYGFFLKDGKQVAGYGPVQSPEQPSAWSTYISTDDANAVAEKVRSAGGQVIAGPFDVMGQGTMAVFTDPSGAFISVWQGGEHQGAQVMNEPNSFAWTELNTRDVDAARAFYTAVFGWGSTTNTFGEGSYTEWKVDDRSVAGMMEMPPQVPPSVPPHWLVYIAVTDADATVARTQELGGQVLVPPIDIEIGRFAVSTDPLGAAFGVMQFNS